MSKKLLSMLAAMTISCNVLTANVMYVTAQEDIAQVATTFEAGIYTGSAEGHNGMIEVEVELSETKVLSVEVVNDVETEHIAEIPRKIIPELVVLEQTVEVDMVTGATITSSAIITAVIDAIEQAGGTTDILSGSPKSDTSDMSQDPILLEADVVVVGGGAAGISAALAAEQKGMSVILLEKNAMLGGHTAFSGGLTWVTGSKAQEELGVSNDTPEMAYDDIMANGGDKSVPELLELYAENMGEATDWSIDYGGAKPDTLLPASENQVDRIMVYEGAGAGLIASLAETLNDTKVDLHLDTRAHELIMDGDEVVGVMAEAKDGTPIEVMGQAVILATGSYAARKDLLPESLQNFVYYGAALASGDGLEMALELDAGTIHMGYVELFENGVEWLPGIAKSTYNGSMASWDQSGILVDRQGVRVVNERGSSKAIVEQQSAQEDGTLFLFMDQATFDIFRDNVGGYGISEEMLDGWLENNGESSPVFANAESVDEVAAIAGVDAESLKETIDTYNSYVANGEDLEFGREPRYMTAEIGEGPYYLVEQKPRYATTLGGLKINTNLQVINAEGNIIEGLFAIGDTAGGVRGDDSISGSDVGWAVTSGYLMGDILERMLETDE